MFLADVRACVCVDVCGRCTRHFVASTKGRGLDFKNTQSRMLDVCFLPCSCARPAAFQLPSHNLCFPAWCVCVCVCVSSVTEMLVCLFLLWCSPVAPPSSLYQSTDKGRHITQPGSSLSHTPTPPSVHAVATTRQFLLMWMLNFSQCVQISS